MIPHRYTVRGRENIDVDMVEGLCEILILLIAESTLLVGGIICWGLIKYRILLLALIFIAIWIW